MRETVQYQLNVLRSNVEMKIDDLERLLLSTYELLDSIDPSDFSLCLAVICHVADRRFSDVMIQQLLHDNVSKSRIFLYDNLLHTRDENYNPEFSMQDHILKAFYTSRTTETTLTKPQKEVFDNFQECRRLIVSAPTSFGKTRIIREIIRHNNYRNIALILPTVSLLSEQYRDIKDSISGYVVSKTSKIKIEPDRNYILVLTPERMSAFLSENPEFHFDFFVMDEIYKTDFKLNDDRFRVFSDVLLRLAQRGSDFYLIGPYITDFSQRFRALFNAKMLKFEVEIVQKDFYFLDNIGLKGSHKIEGRFIKIVGDKFVNLTRLTSNDYIDGKFLIYRYQKRYVEESAGKFSSARSEVRWDSNLIRYLEKTVSPEWKLVSCIKKGVAFHHGAMPRHIQDLIVDEFNNSSGGGIDFLFCTTSLTEGINTSAKNVVLYDEKIGTGDPIGVLDRRNIEGRAGRFMRHFVGRVFHLEAYIENNDDRVVEIESLDSENPSIEAIIQFDDELLSEAGHHKKNQLKLTMESVGLPFEMFKENKYVSVGGQASLLKYLITSKSWEQFNFMGGMPNAEVAKLILSCIYDHLFTESDRGRNFKDEVGKSILLQLTSYYLFYKPSFAELLSSATIIKFRPKIDSRIRYIFDLTSRYFEFIWPRYIMAFQNIYNYAAKINDASPISLELMIAQLEYGTTKNHEIILKDCGIPSESIRKISNIFSNCETLDDVQHVKKLRMSNIVSLLDPIEVRIFNRYI